MINGRYGKRISDVRSGEKRSVLGRVIESAVRAMGGKSMGIFWNRGRGDTDTIERGDNGNSFPHVNLGGLRLEKGDVVIVTAPSGADEHGMKQAIHSTGDILEQALGWRPLILAMPEGWAMGKLSLEELEQFMQAVLTSIERIKATRP